MLRIIAILTVVFTMNRTIAQNLVPNPGFELVSTCTSNDISDSYHSILNWFAHNYPYNSPDIFNSCSTYTPTKIPNTYAGTSFAHSGDGMAGIGIVVSAGHREAISVKLLSELEKDSAYCLSFWIKNSKAAGITYYTNSIGISASIDTLTNSDFTQPAKIKPSIILDKNEWVQIETFIIANGGENFLNIGYFGPLDYHPNPISSDFLYYFIDDFYLEKCNKDSLLSVVLELPNVFTVDGNGVNDEYLLKQNNIKKLNVQVFNRWGNIVREYDGTKEVWNGTDNNGAPLTEGVYFVKAMGETTFGDVVQKTQFVHLIRP